VTDLRSTLVRAATNFVIACSRLLKERYVTSVKIIVPALFKPLTSGTSIIADSCHRALLAIAKSVQHTRTITAILSYASSKCKEHRLIVAESLALIAEWPECFYSSLATELESVTAALSDDAAADVRNAARAINSTKTAPPRKSMIPSPKSSGRRTSVNSASAAKSPSVVRFVEHVEIPDISAFTKPKSIMKHREHKPEAKAIDALMPPKTKQKAETFLQFLNESDEEELAVKLRDRGLLTVQSVSAAAEFIPQFMDWKFVIPRLFNVFPDVFLDMINELLHIFRFDSQLFLCACEMFGVDSLVDKFMNLHISLEERAVKFFAMLIHSGQEFTLTEDLEKYLRRLIKNSKQRKAVETVKKYLVKFADPRRALNGFLDRLKGVGEFSGHLAKLRQCANFVALEPELETEFLNILKKGNDAQRWRVISALSSLSELSFPNLRSALLGEVMRDESPDREMALTCLANQLQVDHIFKETLAKLTEDSDEATEQAVLSVLLRFVTGVTRERLCDALPALFRPVAGLLESDIIPLRRIAMLILVECKVKLGQEFAPYQRRISTPHQKLIEVYLAKRKK
jgi:hypothetical protein